MTPTSKSVTRVTLGAHRGRQLVATLGPGEGIDLASCYDLAVKRRVQKERFEKTAARKGRA